MKKKFKKSILNIHKKAKYITTGATFKGDEVVLKDGTKYVIKSDGSWRKIK
jgi:hypothetical protein